MRVVVTGATGNIGTSLVRLLASDAAVTSVAGVARRRPAQPFAGSEWHEADVAVDDLRPILDGADAVVHLAWDVQPSHRRNALWRTNVLGSWRVAAEAAAAGSVQVLVHASSVGVYSPSRKRGLQDESWPRLGVPSSSYSLQKAEVERRLDLLERSRHGLRIVRMRPALVFKREAASGIGRLFLGGPLSMLARHGLPGAVPDVPDLRFQCVHTDDVAEAFRQALHANVRGAFNLAAEPVLDGRVVAETLGLRRLPMSAGALRAAASVSWRLRLQPTEPGWIDLALAAPLLDTVKARRLLGWAPATRATDALRALADGVRQRAGEPTPRLEPDAPALPAREQSP